jgi:hypothetical protein
MGANSVCHLLRLSHFRPHSGGGGGGAGQEQGGGGKLVKQKKKIKTRSQQKMRPFMR